MKSSSLSQLRGHIEELDRELLRLLNRRASAAVQIGKLKAESGLDIYDENREQAIFKYLVDHNPGPLHSSHIKEVFRVVLAVSRSLQEQAPTSSEQGRSGQVMPFFPLSGKTALYGLLGNPVAQSMGPVMHTNAFFAAGLDAVYVPFEVTDLPAALDGLKALGAKGASVTHPFKEQVMALIDEVEATAQRIGAVNTLVFETGRIRGTNTDWIGAVRCLEALLPIEDRTFVVVGAGGAARAVVFGIVSRGGKVVITNRSEETGRALARAFDSAFVPLAEIETAAGDCLVNTTSVGMSPGVDELPVPEKTAARFEAVADIIYNPLKTRLIRTAEAAGARVATGFEMFLHQGAEQFRIWTGKRPPLELMRKVAYERLTQQ